MQDLYDNLEQFIKDLDYTNNGFPQWYEFGFRDRHGWTALIYWCNYRLDEPIPPELYQELNIQTNKGWTALMRWCFIGPRNSIPPELFQEVNIQTNNGWTALMIWCQFNLGVTIPPELYQEIGLQSIISGHTALIAWCQKRLGESIPEVLYQELHLISHNGWTPLMYWCKYRDEPIPPELLIHLGYQNIDGKTASTIWKENNPNMILPDCLKPELTMELIPFIPPEYRTKPLEFKLL